MTDINARLEAHYNKAVEHFGEENVMGVFLYGSWNYNTNLPDSDVDTKCILVPNLYRLAIQPFKVTHLDVNGEVCECMSIMHMVANWKKQNINFVEILFTPHFKINPDYADFWQPNKAGEWEEWAMNSERSDMVARYNMNAAVKSMANQALNTLKQDPSDLKKIMNTARILYSITNLVYTNESYQNVITVPFGIAEIRTGETPVTPEYIEELTSELRRALDLADGGEWMPNPKEQMQTDEMLNQFIMNLIYRRIALD